MYLAFIVYMIVYWAFKHTSCSTAAKISRWSILGFLGPFAFSAILFCHPFGRRDNLKPPRIPQDLFEFVFTHRRVGHKLCRQRSEIVFWVTSESSWVFYGSRKSKVDIIAQTIWVRQVARTSWVRAPWSAFEGTPGPQCFYRFNKTKPHQGPHLWGRTNFALLVGGHHSLGATFLGS